MNAEAPILIAYDGSDSARDCVSEAAKLFGSRRAVVVTVWESALPYTDTMPGIPLGSGSAIDPEVAREAEHELQARAERIARDRPGCRRKRWRCSGARARRRGSSPRRRRSARRRSSSGPAG